MNRLASVALTTFASLCLGTAMGADESQSRPAPPRLGDRAPIGSLTFADLEGNARTLRRASSDAEWVVVHVFDPGRMDLLPGTKELSREDFRRAGREGGGLNPARTPKAWTLNDHFEQAHARHAHEKGLRWIGITTYDFSERRLKREQRECEQGKARREAKALSGSRRRVLELHLKRREPYSALLQSPSATTLARLGVRAVPAILVFDARGKLLLSWQSLKDDSATNLLLRKLNSLVSERNAAKRAALSSEESGRSAR